MRIAIFIFCTLFLVPAGKAQVSPIESRFDFTFNHLALAVKDLNRSAAFYSEVLGLKEITDRPNDPAIRWFSLGEGKELHLVLSKETAHAKPKEMHLAVSTQKFDDLISFLKRQSVPFSDWPGTADKINLRSDGIRQIYLQDPDGYWIEVNDVKRL